MCMFQEAPAEDPAEPEMQEAGWRPQLQAGVAVSAAVQRAAQQEDLPASQGQPSPPKRPSRMPPSVHPYVPWAIHMIVHSYDFLPVFWLPSSPSMQHSSLACCLTPELAELLLNYMSRERPFGPRTLELFFDAHCKFFSRFEESVPRHRTQTKVTGMLGWCCTSSRVRPLPLSAQPEPDAVTGSFLVVLPTCVPQLRLLSITD
ncbi:uncharacterized protein AKAME5_000720000 [Lates japonicus]|uniref:Uncharacterized protein n=1 Tax=Lates japonicus TaxID=270547 RepID=A0AAD3MJI2_LATJO|nr:uncharacterized protein AKAME5_000720000 [Lates japonicus]